MKNSALSERSESKGFTLVELLVVVAIIAVLSVIGITIFSGVQKNARDTRRKADIDSISKALEANYTGNSTNPYLVVTGSMFSGGIIPLDPQNTGTFVYSGIPTAVGTNYTVCAKLENGTGGNSSDATGTAASNGAFYCAKNQQ